jgi:cytochrome c peroxidase
MMQLRSNLLSGFFISIAFLIFLMIHGCSKDTPIPEIPGEVYIPTPYNLHIPKGFPVMDIPVDNPMTVEGVELGRRLFYDPILSADNSQACASCHVQEYGFTDNGKRFSMGVDGIEGTRSSMAVVNAGWMSSYFWDGRSTLLEDQAFDPVTNPIEMHNTWPAAVSALNSHELYPDLFFKAFGTRNIDSTHVVKAIAQFERTLISANSKWDRYLKGEVQLSQAETKGFEIFFTERGDCFHCHSTILFTDNLFRNNGLDATFTDKGFFEVTGDPNDMGKFKTPTLRNLDYTAPYMHDGRFATLEEVIDFYSHGLQWSETIDLLMKNVHQGGIQLTPDEKAFLIAFLKTLNDPDFITNPEFSNPFINED